MMDWWVFPQVWCTVCLMKPSFLSSEASISCLSFNCLWCFSVSYSILYIVGHFLGMERCCNPNFTFLCAFHCILLMFLWIPLEGTCVICVVIFTLLFFSISKEVVLICIWVQVYKVYSPCLFSPFSLSFYFLLLFFLLPKPHSFIHVHELHNCVWLQ